MYKIGDKITFTWNKKDNIKKGIITGIIHHENMTRKRKTIFVKTKTEELEITEKNVISINKQQTIWDLI